MATGDHFFFLFYKMLLKMELNFTVFASPLPFWGRRPLPSEPAEMSRSPHAALDTEQISACETQAQVRAPLPLLQQAPRSHYKEQHVE